MSVTVTTTETATAVSTVESTAVLDTALEDVVVSTTTGAVSVVEVGGLVLTDTLRMPNNVFGVQGRNAADSAWVNVLKVNTSDQVAFGARFGTDGYLSETNTTGLRGVSQVFVQRYGAGTVSDRTMGYYTNVIDNASVKRVAITAVANNGSGLFRITATAHGAATGDRVMIYGAGGVASVNNAWTVTRIDANTLDLQASTYTAGYTSGGFVSTGGQIYGGQFTVTPIVTRDFGASGGSAVFGDDVIAVAAYNNGSVKGTAAFNAGSNTAAGASWLYGLELDGNYTVGINTDPTAVFSSAGIKLRGTYTVYGIDLGTAVFSVAKPIRIPNSTYITAVNNAGTTDLSLIGLNSSDNVAFDTICRFNAGLIVANTFNMQFSTATGTKIGTTSSEKLAFWGATPVARPSAYTQTYATADKTLATPTSSALSVSVGTGSTTIVDVGGSFSQTTLNNIVRSLADQINNLRTDLLDNHQFTNSVVDDLQTIGLVG